MKRATCGGRQVAPGGSTDWNPEGNWMGEAGWPLVTSRRPTPGSSRGRRSGEPSDESPGTNWRGGTARIVGGNDPHRIKPPGLGFQGFGQVTSLIKQEPCHDRQRTLMNWRKCFFKQGLASKILISP